MTLAPVLAFAAAALAAAGAFEAARAVGGRGPRGAWRRRPRSAGLSLLTRLGRGLGPRPPRDLDSRLAAAGVSVAAADVMAVKAGGAAVAVGAALAPASAAPGRLSPALVVAVPAAAFLAPDAWLRRRARLRARIMEAELADVLDLLRVAVAAGLSPTRALAEVGRRHPGALAAELRHAVTRLELGVPGELVLSDLERRCPAAGVRALTGALRRAERHGAPLGPTLTAQADEARARRAQLAVEAAARAAPKIQLVVALLLVPAVLLLVAAALLPALAGA